MRLSPENDGSDLPLPLQALSFQFSCPPPRPSNSIDLTGFKKQGLDNLSAGKVSPLKDQRLRSSEFRISWREGLISRIFETGDLDCCQWLSDDEDNVNCLREDKEESVFDCSFELNNNKGLAWDEGSNQNIATGSGSFEFNHGGVGAEISEAKAPPPPGPMPCAESISMESGGLISSSDSDWTFSYHNHLFESKR